MADIVFAGQSAAGPLNSGALPSNMDLVIYKGDFVRLRLTIKDSSGTPINLAGSGPRAQLKRDYNDRMPVSFDCELTEQPGEVDIFLPSQKTTALLPGSYIWDFQITYSDGNTRTYLAGDVIVYNEVTV